MSLSNSLTSLNRASSMSDSIFSVDIDDNLKSTFKNIPQMTNEELIESIEKCKNLIADSEEMSIERKWLIRKLVELRFHQVQKTAKIPEKIVSELSVNSHDFRPQKGAPSKRTFCDFCTNCIWIFQQCFTCIHCFYNAHAKCIKHVNRLCAHVTVCEKGQPEIRICPEIGLSLQLYRCAECRLPLMNKQFYLEPRKCHYSGLYFCKTCHWNNYSIVPANIVHNWDFEQRPVSRIALQEINLFYERPVIKLEQINPKLFVFIAKLGTVKTKRLQLIEMKRYLDVCKFALKEKLVDKTIGKRRYLVEGIDFYSIYDLVCVENVSMFDYLSGIIGIFKNHIMNCEICHGHGYICEYCGDKTPIFPFNDGIYKCENCNNCFHRQCITGVRRECSKCIRLKEKKNLTNENKTVENS
ncbi:hypothetical protein PVAND_016003 [Polypedilum vanderplanki]|uniref:Phorbol-ester/DAG-type domain-containing protein n=1 Tax=Polypedilum vanderplanki TaxID=319348 RepID=A0A9J6BEV5_POLVA|nr:hypothetical protein PVAND_016003 [Polypedilum vanderplanki]